MATALQVRDALRGLNALARRDLAAAFAELNRLPADRVAGPLAVVLQELGDKYGTAAAALAADWYDELRDESGAGGRFTAEPVADVETARYRALARWGIDPLFGPQSDVSAALTLLAGGLQRTIADQHRLTIVDNSIRDTAAAGWKRVGVGGSCGFCRMLIDRGHVYTEAGVTFRSHDHCNCAASPEFADNVVRVSSLPFEQSKRNRSEATKKRDNERAYAYIAEKYSDS